jgi:hypothetical protein
MESVVRRPISPAEQRRREQHALSACANDPIQGQGPEPISDDTLGLLKGAQAIADFLGEGDNIRNVYHWLESGFVDAFKMGGFWVSTKDRIRAQFNTTPRHVPSPKENSNAEPEPLPTERRRRSIRADSNQTTTNLRAGFGAQSTRISDRRPRRK